MTKYTDEQYLQMAICYVQCSKRTSAAIKIFFERHGWSPGANSFLKAARMYGDKLQIMNVDFSVDGSQEATTSHTQEPSISKDMGFPEDNLKTYEVPIKKEITISVNEDYTEDTGLTSDTEVQTEEYSCSKTYYPRVPIVYTTRLDDMKIFEQINKEPKLSIKDITSHIILESKPKLKGQLGNVVNPVSKRHPTYLIQTLEQINNIAQNQVVYNYEESVTETANVFDCQTSNDFVEKNETLLNICNPLNIVLERFPFEINLDTNYHCDIEPPAKVSQKEQKLQIVNSRAFATKIQNLKVYCLVIKDHVSNETEMYYISKGVLTKYYSLPKIIDISQIPQASKIPVWEMNACCWYSRQNQIASVRERGIIQFIYKTHGCQPGKCNCCCSGEYNKSSSSGGTNVDLPSSPDGPMNADDMEIKEFENETSQLFYQMKNRVSCGKYGYSEDWLQDLYRTGTSPVFSDTLISKALQYTRVPQQPQLEYTTNPKVLTSPIQMKLTDNTDVELIKITNDNEILTYRKESKDNIDHILKDKTPTCSLKSQNVCCWSARENFLRNCLKYLPNMQCFMKPPHLCQFGNCTCCCKFRPKKLHKLVPITLSNTINSFEKFKENDTLKGSSVMKRQSYENQDPKYQINNNIPEATMNIQSIADGVGPYGVNPCITMVPTLQVPFIQPGHPFVSRTSSPPVQLNSGTSLPVNSTMPPPTKPINIVPEATNTSPMDSTVDSMITTILDRFKDVRLTINEKGQVSAELTTPVHELNTAEVKVLVNILSHAQKQVDELGLVPGTVLNNVNPQNTQIITPPVPSTVLNNVNPQNTQITTATGPGTVLNKVNPKNTKIPIPPLISTVSKKVNSQNTQITTPTVSGTVLNKVNPKNTQITIPTVSGTVLNKVNPKNTQIPVPPLISTVSKKVNLQHIQKTKPKFNIVDSNNDTTDIIDERIDISTNTQHNTNNFKDTFYNFMNINYKSFISLFNGSVFTPEITVPVISDVFTLQQPDEALDESDVPSTSKGIWYKPPDVHKRKVKKGLLEIDTSENEHEPALKKIKIVSPSKLFGSVTTDRSPINESPTMPTVMPLAFQQNDDPLCTNDPINIQPQLFKKYKEPVIQPRFVKKWRKKQTDNDPKINSPTKPKGLKTYKRKIQQSTQPDADTAVIFPKIGHIWGSAELPSKSNKCYEGHENSTPLTDTLTQQSEVIQLAFEPESGIDTVLVEIDDDDDDVSEAILGT